MWDERNEAGAPSLVAQYSFPNPTPGYIDDVINGVADVRDIYEDRYGKFVRLSVDDWDRVVRMLLAYGPVKSGGLHREQQRKIRQALKLNFDPTTGNKYHP